MSKFQAVYYYCLITCIHKPTLGPLTFSDDSGKRTIFGIVSGPGMTHLRPMTTAAFTRVSHPKILDWIKNTMNSYLKWYLKLVDKSFDIHDTISIELEYFLVSKDKALWLIWILLLFAKFNHFLLEESSS